MRRDLFIADTGNQRIRKVAVAGFAGDIGAPRGLALDGAGNLYIATPSDLRVRRVDALTLRISTAAGMGSVSVTTVSPAFAATLDAPGQLAMDVAGNIFIADYGNHAIRRVDAVSGLISTIAGTGIQGYPSGDGGPATSASLQYLYGIVVDAQDNVVFSGSHSCASTFPKVWVWTGPEISTSPIGTTAGFEESTSRPEL